MKEHIERTEIEYPYMTMTLWGLNQDTCKAYNEGVKAAADAIAAIPAADVVELDAVAEMLYVSCGCDECPCNYGPTDEWLPEVCDLQDECPDPKDKLGCWKQYIKHFAERPEYLRGAYDREG